MKPTLGILGGGQLGRMLAMAALPLDIRCRILDPGSSPPAAAVGQHQVGEFDDYAALGEFASGLAAVTYEFENVPLVAAEWLSERLPVYPAPAALAAAQERLLEKRLFERLGIPVPPFQSADNRSEFDAALESIGMPAMVKTRRFGYDGKGQAVVRTPGDADAAWGKMGGRPLIVEGFVPFRRELSILSVRDRNGAIRSYPLVQNEHREGMLRQSIAPAPDLSLELQHQAEIYSQRVLESLDYVGVLAIEFFEVNGRLVANEMAPRVHNSGHWTIEGATTSQFENHVRAVMGLPLGETSTPGYSAMVNLIGTVPEKSQLLQVPGARLHLYGKSPRPNRKLGHVTICAPTLEDLLLRVAKLSI